jgi:hypothetical protein
LFLDCSGDDRRYEDVAPCGHLYKCYLHVGALESVY